MSTLVSAVGDITYIGQTKKSYLNLLSAHTTEINMRITRRASYERISIYPGMNIRDISLIFVEPTISESRHELWVSWRSLRKSITIRSWPTKRFCIPSR